MSRELPIIFDTESVDAILVGRKTQTRRVVKPFPDVQCIKLRQHGDEWLEFCKVPHTLMSLQCSWMRHKPPYRKDDLLWVRETWLELDPRDAFTGERYYYKADRTTDSEKLREEYGYRWKSPVSMPKKVARLWLRVTDVWAERLQDISEADAIAEGVQAGFYDGGNWEETNDPDCPTIPAYERSWSAKRGYPWEENPWVWVYEFEVERIVK